MAAFKAAHSPPPGKSISQRPWAFEVAVTLYYYPCAGGLLLPVPPAARPAGFDRAIDCRGGLIVDEPARSLPEPRIAKPPQTQDGVLEGEKRLRYLQNEMRTVQTVPSSIRLAAVGDSKSALPPTAPIANRR